VEARSLTMAKVAWSLAFLLVGRSFAAQDAGKLPDTPNNPPASQSSLSGVPKNGAVDILTDTQGVDFGPYLTTVLGNVRDNWYRLVPYLGGAKKGRLVVEFAIKQDGYIAETKLLESAGDASLDRAAMEAIAASGPFPALPSEFKGPELALRFHFYYYPDRSDLGGTGPSTTVLSPSQPINAKTRVEILGLLGESRDFDLRPYVDYKVLPMVQANWYRLVSMSGEKAGGDATIEFTILKDGNLSGNKFADGTGHAALGDLAQSAVTKSAPFPALPDEFSGPSVSVRARFLCEPGKSSQGSGEGQPGSTTTSAQDAAQQPPEIVYEGLASGMTYPKIVHQTNPQYTDHARKKKIQGVVLLSLVVTSEGKVRDPKVTRSLDKDLDQQALACVRDWTFEPATKQGQPVAMRLVIEIVFHLY